MSILRKLIVTALAAGTVIAAPSAAFAAATPATHQASAAVNKIHQVPCRSFTFNVYHGTVIRPTCYEGVGKITLDIRNVREITTGENTGSFWIRAGHGLAVFSYLPHETFRFTPAGAELTTLDISRT